MALQGREPPGVNASAIEAYLAHTDQRLSRSAATGIADTSVSAAKQPLLLTGPALQRRVARNRRLVAEFIVWQRHWFPTTPQEHLLVLCGIGQLTGMRLLPRGLFREWTYDWTRFGVKCDRSPVPPCEIPGALKDLMHLVIEAPAFGEAERVERVARVEWEIGIGPIHPFYDGCGRISRYYTCLLSLWLGVPMATHTSREEYFAAANDGLDPFTRYFRNAAAFSRRYEGRVENSQCSL